MNAQKVLARRIAALLHHTGQTQAALAEYLGHRPSWTTAILNGSHGVRVEELDRVAAFFGVSVPSLFEIDGHRFRERRRGQRRVLGERRNGKDRRNTTAKGDPT